MAGTRDQVEQKLRQSAAEAAAAAQEPAAWAEALARLGYAAKGFLFGAVGLLALEVATGVGGEITDPAGVLEVILGQPYGLVLVVVLAVGLAGYALWLFIRALLDPERCGADLSGIAARAGYAAGGLVYAFLAYTAVQLATGTHGEEARPQEWAGWLMANPLGGWLLGLAGVVVLGGAGHAAYRGLTASFTERWRLDRMSAFERAWAVRAGRLGFLAQGVALGLIGLFLVQAAWLADPNRAVGLEGALAALLAQPYGQWLLGVVAVGMIAYGLYNFVEARYHHIRVGERSRSPSN